jgi:hypothetical protein
MRKAVVSEFLTLDGVIEEPGGAEGFEHGGWSFAAGGDQDRAYKYEELFAERLFGVSSGRALRLGGCVPGAAVGSALYERRNSGLSVETGAGARWSRPRPACAGGVDAGSKARCPILRKVAVARREVPAWLAHSRKTARGAACGRAAPSI